MYYLYVNIYLKKMLLDNSLWYYINVQTYIDWIELLMLDRYTWNHFIMCKLFDLRIFTWSFDSL